jgi:hypothetical protein
VDPLSQSGVDGRASIIRTTSKSEKSDHFVMPRRISMFDVAMLAFGCGSFLLLMGYTFICDKL